MEKEFVTYQQSLRLKALGFDEECFGYRDGGGNLMIKKMPHCVISAPTYSQAFRWFREKYNLYHTIDKQGYWFFEIKKDEGFGDLTEITVSYDYNSYEEAESACLDKLIEIVEGLS